MRFFHLIFVIIISQIALAQQTDSIVKTIDTLTWKQVNRVGLDINEVTFVNWSAGGANSISALLTLNSSLRYKKKNLIWFNAIRTRYGINKQEDQLLRKTEDELELISTIGYRKDTISNWYFSGRFNFKTQYSNGYNYPNRDNPISRFMAPGYVFLGGGAEYGKNIEKLSFYLSPLTFKGTFVLDQSLADSGAFGVTPAVFDDAGNKIQDGDMMRTEMGILITNAYEAQVMENIYLRNQLSLYTDYLNSFGNIDVDWEVVFDFKVNNFVKATLGSHIKYDNDVKIIEESENEEAEAMQKGASVQWKQLLGIGVVVDF